MRQAGALRGGETRCQTVLLLDTQDGKEAGRARRWEVGDCQRMGDIATPDPAPWWQAVAGAMGSGLVCPWVRWS